jgi:hypothetical protein
MGNEIIEIRQYEEKDNTSWDDYISRSKEGTFSIFRLEKVLENMRLFTYFIYAERGARYAASCRFF